MITVLYAHPYPRHSRAGRELQRAVQGLPQIHTRNLYALYPDFHIDVEQEQQALLRSGTIVFQHPLYWYHMPALLTLWCEKVLAHGWAYGHATDGRAARALAGKRLLWVATTGGDQGAYSETGYNHYPMDRIATPIEQLARFCGMEWLPPYTVHHAAALSDEDLLIAAQGYRSRLLEELVFHGLDAGLDASEEPRHGG